MYNAQETANRIKQIAKIKNISISKILTDNGLGKGTITKMGNGADVYVQTIFKIAQSLNSSIDYLTGNHVEQQTPEEEHIIQEYRSVTEDGKKAILKQVEYIANDEQYKKYTDISKEA